MLNFLPYVQKTAVLPLSSFFTSINIPLQTNFQIYILLLKSSWPYSSWYMLCDFLLSSWILIIRWERTSPPPSCMLHFPKALSRPGYKAAAQNIFVKWTELNLSQEGSTQEEVLTNKGAEQQLLEVTTLASIWRLFGSFFHFLPNGIRGSAADNRLWHGDLNPGSLQKLWPSRSEDIDQHRKGGGSEIESHRAIQNCKKKAKVLILDLGKGPGSVQSKKRHFSKELWKRNHSKEPLFCSDTR